MYYTHAHDKHSKLIRVSSHHRIKPFDNIIFFSVSTILE